MKRVSTKREIVSNSNTFIVASLPYQNYNNKVKGQSISERKLQTEQCWNSKIDTFTYREALLLIEYILWIKGRIRICGFLVFSQILMMGYLS